MNDNYLKNNSVCLKIDKIILSYYFQIENKTGMYNNVIGIFYHELMIYSTNLFLISQSKYAYHQPIKFPFVNSHYIDIPFEIKHVKFESTRTTKKSQLVQTISKFNFSKTSVALSSDAPISKIKLLIALFPMNRINIIRKTKFKLIKEEYQLEILNNCLSSIIDLIMEHNNKLFKDNFINYVKTFLNQEDNTICSDLLITGTNLNIFSRINSAKFLEKGKKVISLSHGAQSLIVDEPYINYGELSYCTYYIKNGNKPNLDSLSISDPIHPYPKFYNYSSSLIQKIYKPNLLINKKRINENSKILYVPTLFSGNIRYGPYRDIDDEDYLKWQKTLNRLGLDITYKDHPKSKYRYQHDFKKYTNDNLKKVFNNYDIFFLDYLSTASAILMATNKPIIYFNLGLRNPTPDVLLLLKKRMFWVNIDLNNNLLDQIKAVVDNYNNYSGGFENKFTEKYSLSKNNHSIYRKVKEIIDEQ